MEMEVEKYMGLSSALLPARQMRDLRLRAFLPPSSPSSSPRPSSFSTSCSPASPSGDVRKEERKRDVNVIYLMDVFIGYIPSSILLVLSSRGGEVAFFSTTDKEGLYALLAGGEVVEVEEGDVWFGYSGGEKTTLGEETDGGLGDENKGRVVGKEKQIRERHKESEKNVRERKIRALVKGLVNVLVAPDDPFRARFFYPYTGSEVRAGVDVRREVEDDDDEYGLGSEDGGGRGKGGFVGEENEVVTPTQGRKRKRRGFRGGPRGRARGSSRGSGPTRGSRGGSRGRSTGGSRGGLRIGGGGRIGASGFRTVSSVTARDEDGLDGDWDGNGEDTVSEGYSDDE